MAFRIIPRAEWGATAGDGVGDALVPAAGVRLHHSVTEDEEEARDIRHIEQIGVQRFGWDYGVPYTWVIDPDGHIYEGHDPAKMGAHTYGRNDTERAICWIGNYQRDWPTEQIQRATAWLLQHAHDTGWISRPALAGGHRDVGATLCPGDHAYNAIDDVNRLAAQPIEEDDLTEEDRAMLRAVYHQLTGSPVLGEYPGWPAKEDITRDPKTLVDYARALHFEQLKRINGDTILGHAAGVPELKQRLAAIEQGLVEIRAVLGDGGGANV